MQIIRDAPALKAGLAGLRAPPGGVGAGAGNGAGNGAGSGGAARTLALVPTMGALHAGHMALVARAAKLADAVVATIFVNPKQFGPTEDFAAYPRDQAADAEKLAAAGVAILYAPAPEAVYPPGFATSVSVAGLDRRWCGAARPGHFDGVATIVTKLICQIRPDVAVFGEKDWQQLAIIRRLVADLDLGCAVEGVPVQRAADGLALSSRNAYLTPSARAAAAALPAALRTAADALRTGAPVAATLAVAKDRLVAAGFAEPDYLALIDGASLVPLDALAPGARLIVAARLEGTRLIDNVAV